LFFVDLFEFVDDLGEWVLAGFEVLLDEEHSAVELGGDLDGALAVFGFVTGAGSDRLV